jgi:hypothetical protein
MRTRERLSWILAGVLGLFVAASLAETVSGGSLDPPGPPAPTLRPLEDVLPAWNIRLPSNDGTSCSSSRFVCIFDDQAVFDRETGLVWERFVQTSSVSYGNAHVFCNVTSTGGRLGWRLPTTAELTSLINPGGSVGPLLPDGHPFMQVHGSDPYWTSTPMINPASGDRLRETVFFDYGLGTLAETGETARYWCVRGGQGHDA